MEYFVLAYYAFTNVEDPHLEIKKHKKFLKNRDCAGRIYLSEEGVNGQMSAAKEDAEAYMQWMHSNEAFADMQFKIHMARENIFPRMTVKYRKQIVAMDQKVDMSMTAEHVSPEKWSEMLESEDHLVIDVRNDYESKIGHFKNAECPPLKTFRDFPKYADDLKKKIDPANTKVMMYCTGGIRCELYSALLKEKGFDQVYQLDGGVINYGLKEGKKHWEGKLFVFDERLAVPIDGNNCAPISICTHCEEACDTYYNCANMVCNELFLCCISCLKEHLGCCQSTCMTSAHVRPLELTRGNKPFRRKHLIEIPETV